MSTRSLAWSAAVVLVGLILAEPAGAQEATQSPHGQLKESCSTCHGSAGWTPVRVSRKFDHGKFGFPLAGAHAETGCRACHQSLEFKGTAPTCASCHKDVHQGELGVDCAHCHTPRSFLDRAAMTRAHQLTRFPLSGSHLALDCSACHTPAAQGRMVFVNRASNCVDCHLASYLAARNPDHQAGGFPRECSQCHAATVWTAARFNHSITRFPLTGAHRAVTCQQCHGDGVYAGKVSTCVGCHQADYDGATSPAHRTAGFSTDCTTCHSTVAWTGAGFDHNATPFPLTGAHKSVGCQQCHGDGVFAGKSTVCVACHQQDYAATVNPNHQAAQFPTTCADCHTTTQWLGATFNHDAAFFPINSGKHRNTWSSCATCHTNGGNFTVFTCLLCHEHNQTQMDGTHRGQSGYAYDSQRCYSCHPDGRSH